MSFLLFANKNKLTVQQREAMTSGSVNVNSILFEFSNDWDELDKTVVFRSGNDDNSKKMNVLLDHVTNECSIPWEMLSEPGIRLQVGVYGTQNGSTVLPTIWADLGEILRGAAPDEKDLVPTPELWRQELDKKQNKLHGLPGQTVSFDENGNAVAQDPAGGAVPVPGKDGKSAYEIAVENGFIGTETEWLESLKGDPGPAGKDGKDGVPGLPGENGTDGKDGKSAYEIAVENGFDGSEQEWLESLIGPPGQDGADGENGNGVPAGGSAGQVLGKNSDADYDTTWITLPTCGDEPVESTSHAILTEAQYDALTDDEKENGVYLIPGNTSKTPDPSGNVYSAEETITGTWIDGKPLYRKVLQFTSPNETSEASVTTISTTFRLTNQHGFLLSKNGEQIPIGFSDTNALVVACVKSNGDIRMHVSMSHYTSCDCFLVIEYTKTTDEAVI